jgi:alkanesulfonate monooxygenase SsuD/methylene tetrahydromethanopterin reductase-like flavin-dependent oxidoreductase (luciferase family)
VKLSAFTVVDALPPEVAGDRDRYAEVLSLAEAAEAGGLSALWVAEHHFQEGGLCPSPPVLLAACGARTRRLRLGVLVSVLPFHRPVDVAEEYALLDRITGGRLNLGLGSGYIPAELDGFGVDPATKRERFDAAYTAVLAALEGREITVDAPSARPVRLNVRPAQQPRPPVWIAVQRREAIPFVARRGCSVALIPYATVQDLDELGEEIHEFRAALPAGVTAEVAVGVHLYAGADPNGARAALRRYLDSRLKTQSAFYAQKVAQHPEHASVRTLEDRGLALLGEPSEVVRGLGRFARLGVDEVLGIFDFGGLTAEDVARSVAALGAEFARA